MSASHNASTIQNHNTRIDFNGTVKYGKLSDSQIVIYKDSLLEENKTQMTRIHDFTLNGDISITEKEKNTDILHKKPTLIFELFLAENNGYFYFKVNNDKGFAEKIGNEPELIKFKSEAEAITEFRKRTKFIIDDIINCFDGILKPEYVAQLRHNHAIFKHEPKQPTL